LTIADPNAGSGVISPKMFREWVKPYLGETIDYIKSRFRKPICLHICGYIDPIMEDIVSLGVDAISMDSPASLKKMVEVSQGRVVIEGNFPGELYVEGTKEQIEEKVKESIDTAAEPSGYKYILCSGCQVPANAPLENISHFMEFGRQYGRYH
jgi:uroporphyrinogen decarboxylase